MSCRSFAFSSSITLASLKRGNHGISRSRAVFSPLPGGIPLPALPIHCLSTICDGFSSHNSVLALCKPSNTTAAEDNTTGCPGIPAFDILADSLVHNRTMLSLSSHTDVLPSPGLAVARGSGGITSTGFNPSVPSPGRVNRSPQLLESQAHTVRLEIRAREQESKATPKDIRAACQFVPIVVIRDPTLAALPALPIIAAKVAMFLQYESTWEKKQRGTTETIAGSSIGKSQISQVISALEDYRRNSQHLYKDCLEAQIPLRNDQRIRQFESAAAHDEPNRAEKAQVTKAAGEFFR
ncbi:hypothetical protein B0H14DRAFT_3704951 [Mycena olivaceomarginata]|nr:hypothetical protein B0H14DRAFT_3704951 [Mycena olivaceomarginata]